MGDEYRNCRGICNIWTIRIKGDIKSMNTIKNLRYVLDLLDELPRDDIHNKIFEIVEDSIFDIEDMAEKIDDLEYHIEEIRFY